MKKKKRKGIEYSKYNILIIVLTNSKLYWQHLIKGSLVFQLYKLAETTEDLSVFISHTAFGLTIGGLERHINSDS